MIALLLTCGGSVLAGKEKPGVAVVAEKKDGQAIQGELLAVGNGMVNILIPETAAKAYLRYDELNSVRIVRKGTMLKGLGTGVLIGAVSGGLLGLLSGDDRSGWFRSTAGQKALALGVVFAGGAGIIGGVAGALRSIDETVRFEGRSAAELALVTAKLASRSRFGALPAAGIPAAPEPIRLPESPPAVAAPDTPAVPPVPARRKPLTRWHVSLLRGFSYSQGGAGLGAAIARAGFGDDYSSPAIWFLPASTTVYPTKDSCKKLSWSDIRVDYSLTPSLALGLDYSPLGEHLVRGRMLVDRFYGAYQWVENAAYLLGRYRGGAIFASATYMPLPDLFLSKALLRVGAGVGLSIIRGDFMAAPGWVDASDWSDDPEQGKDTMAFRSLAPALTGFFEMGRYFGRHFSLGITGFFKSIPFKNDSGRLEIPWVHEPGKTLEVIPVDVPRKSINAGGFGFGLALGFHL